MDLVKKWWGYFGGVPKLYGVNKIVNSSNTDEEKDKSNFPYQKKKMPENEQRSGEGLVFQAESPMFNS